MKHGTCKHFTSITEDVCDAGVRYREVKLPCGALSCFAAEDSRCGSRCEPTAEEVAAFDRESDAFVDKMMERMEKLEPLLDKIRTKYRGRDMHGHATCPVCGVKGALTVSHSKRKGHIHAFCTTEGCVRMME